MARAIIGRTREKIVGEKTSLDGTIRKSRQELCDSMTAPQKGNVCGSQFFFNEDAKCLFVCYKPKTNKTVSLLSSMHTNTEICDGQKAKPEILNFYNKNKGEVDVFDQMSRKFSCHSASRLSLIHI